MKPRLPICSVEYFYLYFQIFQREIEPAGAMGSSGFFLVQDLKRLEAWQMFDATFNVNCGNDPAWSGSLSEEEDCLNDDEFFFYLDHGHQAALRKI